MSSTQTEPTNGTEPLKQRGRRPRSPSKPRPVFIVAQILDPDGEPVPFNKKDLRILSVELSAEKVLEITEGGENEHAFYVRLVVPPRQAQAPMRPAVHAHNMISPNA